MLLPPSDERWKIRSRTFQGIANAMAEQWSNINNKENPNKLIVNRFIQSNIFGDIDTK